MFSTEDFYHLVEKRRNELGLSQAKVSQLAFGKDGDTSLIQNLRRGSIPKADKLEKLSRVLGFEFYIGPPRLNTDGPKPVSFVNFSPNETLPRKGIAKCSIRAWGKDQPENDPLPKPEWLGDPDAFYVSARGQSMELEGIEGANICLVSPAQDVKVGDRVWIKDKAGKTSIKRLIGMDDKWVDLLGWEPISDGKQKSFEDKHARIYIEHMYPVIAVYRGRPGSDNVEFKPDPKAVPSTEPAIIVNADNEHSHSFIKLHDIQAAAGSGSYVQDDRSVSSLAFPNPWLAKIGINPNDASLIFASGTSMTPTIQDGAMILINHQNREVKKKQIYVFRQGEELFIKRLEKITPDTLIVLSDNPDNNTRIIAGYDLESIHIIGQVVWSGGKITNLGQ